MIAIMMVCIIILWLLFLGPVRVYNYFYNKIGHALPEMPSWDVEGGAVLSTLAFHGAVGVLMILVSCIQFK